jgi:hypothetical protein
LHNAFGFKEFLQFLQVRPSEMPDSIINHRRRFANLIFAGTGKKYTAFILKKAVPQQRAAFSTHKTPM